MGIKFNPSELPKLSFSDLEEIAYVGYSTIALDFTNRAIADIVMRQVDNAYLSKIQASYQALPREIIPVSQNVEENIRNAEKLAGIMARCPSASLFSIDSGLNSVKVLLDQTEARELGKYHEGLAHLEGQRKAIIDGIQNDHNRRIDQVKAEREIEITKERARLKHIEEAIQNISSSFADSGMLSVYGLQHPSLAINVDEIGIEDYETILQLCAYSIRLLRSRTPLSMVSSLLYLPVDMKVKKGSHFPAIYFLALASTILLGSPYVLGVMSFFFFINLILNIYRFSDNRKLIEFAYQLSENSEEFLHRLDVLILKGENIMKYTRQLREIEFEDVDGAIASATESISKDIEKFKETDPSARLKEIRDYVLSDDVMSMISCQITETMQRETQELKELYGSMQRNHQELLSAIKNYSDNLPMFGTVFSKSHVLSMRLCVCARYYKDMRIGYYYHTLPFENILFRYVSDTERNGVIGLLKLFYINAICNVYAGSLKTIIHDPLNLGGDFSELFNVGLTKVLDMPNENFDDQLKRLMGIAKNNMFKIGSKTVTDYNEESEKAGRVTIPYYLWIILSFRDDIWNNKEFQAFLEYSTSRGIWIWVVQQQVYTDRGIYDPEKNLNLPITVTESGKYRYQGKVVDYSVVGSQPIEYSLALGVTARDAYINELAGGNIVIVDYEKAFRQKVVPDDKIWSFNTLDGIELHFGFLDGDPNKPLAEVLGDTAVHCLMAGMTGSGKSATINQTLATLLYMYPPEWLQLVMIDFKNVEFSMYTGDCLIPHASIISGTKDGEYAVSVFAWVMDEMKRRQKLLAKHKCQKIKDYNERLLKNEFEGTIIPRVLLLFDEFQAMFVAVADTMLDKIKKSIMALTKEARALGIHLWFTSQSMKGTMSDDILEQFQLRVCLSVASADTSKSILGNAAASELPPKGWLFANSANGKEQFNHRYQIPYASNSYIRAYLPKLIARVTNDKDSRGRPITHVHRHADFYDEAEIHYEKDLRAYYEKYEQLKADPYLFLLGERTSFSSNALPENLRLLNSDGENIALCAYERPDCCNILKTLLDNLDYKEDAVVVATVGDVDIAALIDIDSYLNDLGRQMSPKEKASELIPMLVEEVTRREENRDEAYISMYYFLIALDKMPDVDNNYRLWDEAFTTLIQRGPAVGIHTIVSARDARKLRRASNFCTHLLCSRTTESMSGSFLETSAAAKLAEKVCYYRFGTESAKFKIYQHEFDPSRIQERVKVINKISK